jgi:hypothetical protein
LLGVVPRKQKEKSLILEAVKRKYLPRAMGELMSYSKEELEQMLRELNKS